MARIHSLTSMEGELSNHSQKTTLRGFLVKTLRQCNIIHAVESTPPSKEGTGNEGGSLKMDILTSAGSLLSEYPRFGQHGLILDVTVANSCAPSALDAFVDVVGSILAKAISRKHCHCRGKFYNMNKLEPLGVSICGEYSVDMHRVLQGLAKRRAQKCREALTAAEEAILLARETGT